MPKGIILIMNNKLIVNSIQRSCFHDGPGIRTTVFLHSCSLKCPWCSNPECSMTNYRYVINNRCRKSNGKCIYNIDCPSTNNKESNDDLKNFIDKCPVLAIENNFRIYSIDELKETLVQDKFLFDTDGGITFSGGEPLLQSYNLGALIRELKKEQINIAVETCLFVEQENLLSVVDDIDLFIVDLKILDAKECSKILGGDLKEFLNNIEILFAKKKDVIFRVPLIKPYITNKNNMSLIYKFLTRYKPLKVELLKGHNLAKEKYQKLGIEYKLVSTINETEINDILKEITRIGINATIIDF